MPNDYPNGSRENAFPEMASTFKKKKGNDIV